MDSLNTKVQKKSSIKMAFGFGFNYFNYIVNSMFISYLTYFATNSLYMAAANVGLLLMVSKLFDGFTDVFAGILIDKTKYGKARPYALFGILAWISLVLVFCVPNFSEIGKTIYIFIFYNLNMSVFFTLVNVARTLHLKRAIHDEQQRIRILTLSGFLYSVGSIVLNIVFPIVVAKISGNQNGWIAMASVLAIIGIVGSTLCFLWCPEIEDENQEDAVQEKIAKEKVPFKVYLGTV